MRTVTFHATRPDAASAQQWLEIEVDRVARNGGRLDQVRAAADHVARLLKDRVPRQEVDSWAAESLKRIADGLTAARVETSGAVANAS